MSKASIGALVCAVVAGVAIAGACSATNDSEFDDEGSSSSSGQGGQGAGLVIGTGGQGAGILQTEPPCDDSVASVDGDGDGWTDDQGDCNDCTEQMNPGALDYTGNNIDEDCNGAPDDNPVGCDSGIAMSSNDAMDAARAVDLCKISVGEGWGVVSAEYLNVDGTGNSGPSFDIGHGVLPTFGAVVKPQQGSTMLALSSGAARAAGDPGYEDPTGYDKFYTSGPAPGFPVESPACPGVTTGETHDSVMLRLRIKTPTNAKTLAFNVDFYTYEYPIFICSEFNDFVTAILSPAPPGLPNGNISFDAQGNPLSVNAGFLEACKCPIGNPPCDVSGKIFTCALGTGQLQGTGYEPGAATGWLQTTAPIMDPGEVITLELGAWDSGDGDLDSLGLFDNFTFQVEETPTATQPIEDPK